MLPSPSGMKGTGMHPDTLNNVFHHREKLSGRTTGKKAVGWDLSLLRNLLKKNNGKIDIHSVISEGTSISVTFPYKVRNKIKVYDTEKTKQSPAFYAVFYEYGETIQLLCMRLF
jgi:hypothetical protein